MIFFAFLFVLIGYLAIARYLSKKVYQHLEARGKGRLLASMAAGLVMVLAIGLVFWDAFPTWYTHRRLCHTEFGLTVYMTPEEWANKYPERYAQIRPIPRTSSGDKRITGRVSVDIDHINSELDSVMEDEKEYGFGVVRTRHRYVDSKTGEVLIEDVDFYGGVSGGSLATGANSLADYKFWLTTLGCGFAYHDLRPKYDAEKKALHKIYETILGWTK